MLEQPDSEHGQGQQKGVEHQIEGIDLMNFVGFRIEFDIGGFRRNHHSQDVAEGQGGENLII